MSDIMVGTASISGLETVEQGRGAASQGWLGRLWRAWSQLWARAEEDKPVKVAELMNAPPVVCPAVQNLNDAAKLMWDHDCGIVMVTDDKGRLVGVITDRDICMATYTRGRPPSAILVSEVMARNVACVRPSADIAEAGDLMADRQVRRLAVVDEEECPIGLISVNDLVVNAAAEPASSSRLARVVDVLAAIGRHRESSSPTESEAA